MKYFYTICCWRLAKLNMKYLLEGRNSTLLLSLYLTLQRSVRSLHFSNVHSNLWNYGYIHQM